MTIKLFSQLFCDNRPQGCREVFPKTPIINPPKALLRDMAREEGGWRVRTQNRVGKDLCPKCKEEDAK